MMPDIFRTPIIMPPDPDDTSMMPSTSAPESARRHARQWLPWLPVFVLSILALLFVVALFTVDHRHMPSALIGKAAPDFVLPTLDDDPETTLNRADLIGDVPVIVNFWASWCPPCRAEHSNLMALARRGDIRLIGINYRDQNDPARRFLDELGNPFSKVGRDQDGRVAVDFGVYGVPETFILSPQGMIQYRHAGPIDATILNDTLLPLLKHLGADPT